MSLSAAVIETLVGKGMSAQDILDIAKASEVKTDRTAAERQARYREKRRGRRNAVTLRRDPPIDNTHTPSVPPNGETPKAGRDPFPRPAWADDDEVWGDFLSNRKRKRMPNTATAHKAFLDDIARIADDEWPPGRLLKHAAAKGWGGIYDPRETGKSKHDKPTASNDEIANPYVRVAARREAERAAAER